MNKFTSDATKAELLLETKAIIRDAHYDNMQSLKAIEASIKEAEAELARMEARLEVLKKQSKHLGQANNKLTAQYEAVTNLLETLDK